VLTIVFFEKLFHSSSFFFTIQRGWLHKLETPARDLGCKLIAHSHFITQFTFLAKVQAVSIDLLIGLELIVLLDSISMRDFTCKCFNKKRLFDITDVKNGIKVPEGDLPAQHQF
jgi:hypothetical protein